MPYSVKLYPVAQVFLSAQLEPQQLFLFFRFPKTNQLIQKHKKMGIKKPLARKYEL